MKRKVCVVITAWSNYSRFRTALQAIAAHPKLELQLVLAASALLDRYGNLPAIVEHDGFRVAARVFMVVEGTTPLTSAKTTGLALLELASVFDKLRPDVVVTIGDRYETLATAIAASYMNISLVHVEGGEVTGSIDEKVRHAVTKLSDLHFVSTKKAYENAVKMGEDPEKVFLTGCPSIDLAAEVTSNASLDFDPCNKYGGVGASIDLAGGYLVVIQHPVTTEYQKSCSHVTETLCAVRDLGLPTLWFWPNLDAGSDGISRGIRAFRELEKPSNIRFFKNMEPADFLRLVYNSLCIVGNSSVGIRECSFLGIPAVDIGTRQTGRERGRNIIDVDYNRDQIKSAVQQQVRNGRFPSNQIYGDGQAGEKIAHLLATVPVTIEKRLIF